MSFLAYIPARKNSIRVKNKNIFYLMTGSIISGLGLLYDSYPVVLGSMLISPMGGPIFRTISNILNNEN